MDIVTGCEQPFRGREARVIGDGGPARQRDPRIGASGDLGFGRIVVSKAEAPNLFVNMVESGSTVLQSDDAIEPGADHGVRRGTGHREARQDAPRAGGDPDGGLEGGQHGSGGPDPGL